MSQSDDQSIGSDNWCDDVSLNTDWFNSTESANNQKLMLEYEKFQEQQAKMMKMQEDYDRQLQEMEESKERALEELTEYYETKLQEMTTKLEQVTVTWVVKCWQ